MKNEFIPYEQALALKELGFDEPCFGGYYSNQDNVNLWFFKEAKNSDRDERVREGFATAPTYSQAFRWFREKCGLRHFIEYDNGHYNAVVQSSLVYHCDTHEEAELACLNRLIILITPITNPQTKPWT
jgi:hypothetical protein